MVATVRNDTAQPQRVALTGTARSWSGSTPESGWQLGEAVLAESHLGRNAAFAIDLYQNIEQLLKPSDAALVEHGHGQGKIVCSATSRNVAGCSSITGN